MASNKTFSVRIPDGTLKAIEKVADNIDVSRNQLINMLVDQRLRQIINSWETVNKTIDKIERVEGIQVDKKGMSNITDLVWSQIKHNEDHETAIDEAQIMSSIQFVDLVRDEDGIDQELLRNLDELKRKQHRAE